MSTLTVTPPSTLAAAEPPPSRDVSLARLPNAMRREVLMLDRLFKGITGKVRPALAALSERTTIPPDTLKRKFYDWQADGIVALIDHRKCRCCELPGCTASRHVTIPEETIKEWQRGDILNDKRGMQQSWETRIIHALQQGKSVPGLGTWQALFSKLRPFSPLPPKCPWHIHNPPPGFSLSSFRSHHLSKAARKLGKKGEFAAWSELPEVRIDLSLLKPLEWIVFDDHRLDFYCWIEAAPGKFQKVEMWGVFAMDVATRKIIAFGLKPRIIRTDGTALGIERRDVQHLIAHILATYGIPKDYALTLLVENAAAAITEELELMLTHLFKGRVKVKRTGLHTSDALISGFPEKWGNYRGKRWLESYFNPLDIALGTVKGQMGSNYWEKPGRTDAQIRLMERMCAIMPALTDEQRQKLDLPFHWAGDAHQLVQAAVDALNTRTDHECAGFEKIPFFAWSKNDHQPKPVDLALAKLHGTEADLAIFSGYSVEHQNLLLSYAQPRVLSPEEKFELNYHRARFVAVAEETFLHLLMDESQRANKDGAPIIYRGGDVLDVLVKQGTRKYVTRFRGRQHELQLDDQVRVIYNADNLAAGIFIVDEHGRPMGRMRHSADPLHDDVEGLNRQLGDKQRALREVVKSLRGVALQPAQIEEQTTAIENNLTILNTLKNGGASTTATALPESSDLIQTIRATRGTKRKTTAPLSAANMVFVGEDEEEEG